MLLVSFLFLSAICGSHMAIHLVVLVGVTLFEKA